ncbi:PD-(D/E)XK nuclease family protein [Stygiolobus caldivivus]|uniref:DUF3782 domain-containing protein n=1 Tax=Stygiolobus caldivivus TaxID=2824673 RepID=A0A8D5ZI23_9CREN|nr:PD-(D/E)XK nuclease family protein [Stygiolobus caldivivus]BCU68912.1 hypothetical protein KN1_02090 [Stygiolobus caldivivus]
MSLADEIKKVLIENPSILADVLTTRPEIIYQALSRLMPWQNLATKDDLKNLATKDDLKNLATKDDLKNLATKEELEEVKRVMATKDDIKEVKNDIKRLEITLSALGARWGITAESVFRQGIMELLADAGWKVDREVIFDKEGIVYGYPSEVEIDVVLTDGKVILVELTASLKRSDLLPFSRKKELYEKVKGRKVSEVVVVTPFIDDKNEERIIAIANSLGIRIIKPGEIESS